MTAITLLHGSSSATIPASPAPFVLTPSTLHKGSRVWQSLNELAPPDLLYLGDGVAVAFAAVAAERVGGDPVVVQVEVPEEDLVPDPSYASMAGALGVKPSWRKSVEESGRIATQSALAVTQRWIGSDKVLPTTVHYGLYDQIAHWHDENNWRAHASRHGLHVSSAYEFRRRVGLSILRDAFRQY